MEAKTNKKFKKLKIWKQKEGSHISIIDILNNKSSQEFFYDLIL